MRAPPLLPVLALLCLCCGACGSSSASHAPASGAQPAGEEAYMHGDEDVPGDDSRGGHGDDVGFWGYGREATPAERQAFLAVVRRYYQAAAAGDGSGACALIDSKIVRSSDIERAIPAEDRPSAGSSVFRGGSCAQDESLLFEIDRQRLADQALTVRLIAARVEGARGLALLDFRSTGERDIALAREHGAWKIGALLDERLR
jgi:hypothetical protein